MKKGLINGAISKKGKKAICLFDVYNMDKQYRLKSILVINQIIINLYRKRFHSDDLIDSAIKSKANEY
jgi:hypothetical protein